MIVFVIENYLYRYLCFLRSKALYVDKSLEYVYRFLNNFMYDYKMIYCTHTFANTFDLYLLAGVVERNESHVDCILLLLFNFH